MPLTDHDLRLVQESLERIRDEFDSRSIYFYDVLFERAPRLKDLFRDDLAGQGMKFMTTLDLIVRHLHNEEGLADRFRRLGELHAAIGITQADFAPMEEALIDTMRDALQEAFTPEVEQAWRKAYGILRRNMTDLGSIPE